MDLFFSSSYLLLIGDLADMKPEYICNTVVNNWQKEPGGVRSDSYELLTLSPTGIERLDENPEEHDSFAGTAIIISTVFFFDK